MKYPRPETKIKEICLEFRKEKKAYKERMPSMYSRAENKSTEDEVCQLVDTYFGQLHLKSPFLSLAHYSCSPLRQGQLWRDKEKVFDLIRNGTIRQSDMDGTTFIFHAIM